MKKRILWKKIKQRGPILWDNADSQSCLAGYSGHEDEDGNFVEDKAAGTFPATYFIRSYLGNQLNQYESLSALQPCGNKKSPFEFCYMAFDEDEGTYEDLRCCDVEDPLHWQTEQEFLQKQSKA